MPPHVDYSKLASSEEQLNEAAMLEWLNEQADRSEANSGMRPQGGIGLALRLRRAASIISSLRSDLEQAGVPDPEAEGFVSHADAKRFADDALRLGGVNTAAAMAGAAAFGTTARDAYDRAHADAVTQLSTEASMPLGLVTEPEVVLCKIATVGFTRAAMRLVGKDGEQIPEAWREGDLVQVLRPRLIVHPAAKAFVDDVHRCEWKPLSQREEEAGRPMPGTKPYPGDVWREISPGLRASQMPNDPELWEVRVLVPRGVWHAGDRVWVYPRSMADRAPWLELDQCPTCSNPRGSSPRPGCETRGFHHPAGNASEGAESASDGDDEGEGPDESSDADTAFAGYRRVHGRTWCERDDDCALEAHHRGDCVEPDGTVIEPNRVELAEQQRYWLRTRHEFALPTTPHRTQCDRCLRSEGNVIHQQEQGAVWVPLSMAYEDAVRNYGPTL